MNINKNILESLNRNKPSPILLEESKSSFIFEFIFAYMKSLCCQKSKDSFCDNCTVCKKINKNKYFDCYIFNTYLETLHKEKASEILTNFSYSSLEKYGFKFLVIYGVENINKQVANMLLKSVEEPFKNTFYIFTTRNSNNVINTIRSRCFFYRVKPDYLRFKEELVKNQIDKNYINFFANNFYSIDEVKTFINAENFESINELFNLFISNKSNISRVHKGLTKFKKLSYYELTKLILMLEPYIKDVKRKEKIYYLVNSLKYNINKTLVYSEILNII